MAKIIDVSISIDGKQISRFHNLRIQQSINVHHSFEVHLPFVAIDSSTSLVMSDAIKLIGTDVVISLKSKNGGSTTKFEGVVTHIKHQVSAQQINSIILSGKSKTIHLDGTPTIRAFSDKKFSEIISLSTSGYGSKIKVSESVQFKSKLKYRVQHNETTFNFLRRLASEFGESFYYDGTHLVIGKLNKGRSADLAYPKELTDISFGLGVGSLKSTSFNYDYILNKTNIYTVTSKDADSVSPLAQESVKKSFDFFESNNMIQFPYDLDDKSHLDTITKKVASVNSGRLSTVSGETDTPGLTIGSAIKLSVLAKKNSDNSNGDYGEFVVSSVIHSVDGIGNYYAHFEGLSKKISDFPNPYNQYVTSNNQVAIVKDTNDPDKLGRVKVSFNWMNDGEMSNWIRLMSSHAGKDRGSIIIPELEEEVIVGFENGNPSVPFVIGSLYHGKVPPVNEIEFKPSKATLKQDYKGNNLKFFQSKSGNKVVFDDTDGDEKILISDASNSNGIIIQVKDSKIEIHSEKDVLIKSKNISLEAEKDISISAQDGNINMVAGSDITAEAKGSITSKATKDIKANATMDVTIESGKNMNIKGTMNTSVEAGVQMNTKGAMVTAEASAVHTVKGALVKIN